VAFSTYIEYGSPVSSDYPIFSSSGQNGSSSSYSFYVSAETGAKPTFSGSEGEDGFTSNSIGQSLYSYASANSEATITERTRYVAGEGFAIDYDGAPETYYFSDGGVILFQYTTSDTNGNFNIRKTTKTDLSTVMYEKTATWTDRTTTASNVNIQYTGIQSLSTIGSEIQNLGTLYFPNAKLVIDTACGYVWTSGQNELKYLHYFTSNGEVSHNNGSKIKEDDAAVTIFADFGSLNGNLTPAKSADTTIQEESATTVTYDYLNTQNSTITISSNTLQFDGIRFYTNSVLPTTINFEKRTTASSTISFKLANLISASGDTDAYASRDIFTTTKAIQISTTDTFYHINSFYSYFESFTYKGLIKTTAESSYMLFQAPDFGSTSSDTFDITTFFTRDEDANGVVQEASGSTIGANGITSYYRIPQYYYKSYYSLYLGIANDNWKKYYTRKVGNSNFAVQHSNGSSFSYVKSLGPTSVLTKCFFKSYNFERAGAGKAPAFYVPIAYTSVSTDSKTTEQAVSVPQGFYFGNTQASIYWTTKSEVNTSSTQTGTTSFMVSYAGAESMLSIGYDAVNDFEANTFDPPFGANKIFHTQPEIYSGSWVKEGYYYYNGAARTSFGAASNAISVIGDGQYATYIGSEYVDQIAFPVVSITRSYVNSYGY
jgi:hypothetical protein